MATRIAPWPRGWLRVRIRGRVRHFNVHHPALVEDVMLRRRQRAHHLGWKGHGEGHD